MKEPIEDVKDAIEQAGSKIGGPVGSKRWELVTALFGWSALLALVGFVAAFFLGLSDIAKWAVAVFCFAFGIAFKRDVLRLLLTGRMTR